MKTVFCNFGRKMLEAGLQGLILGLILSIPVSPIFFLLVSTSIEKGFHNALVFKAGIITSDVMCIVLIYFGLADYLSEPGFQIPVYMIGGIFLFFFGLITLFRKKKEVQIQSSFVPAEVTTNFFKGFFLNISNPAVPIFWLGAVSIALVQFKSVEYAVGLYFVILIATVLFFDIIKAWLSDYIRKWLTAEKISLISKFSAVAMSVFGIYLTVKGVMHYKA